MKSYKTLVERMEIGRDIRVVYTKILQGESGLEHCLELLKREYLALGGRPDDQINRAKVEFGEEDERRSWAAHDVLVRVERAERAKEEREKRAAEHEEAVRQIYEREAERRKERCDQQPSRIRQYKGQKLADPTKMREGISSSGIITEYSLAMTDNQIERLFNEHNVNWDMAWGGYGQYYRNPDDPERPLTQLQEIVVKIVGQVGGSIADICRLTGFDNGLVRFVVFGLYRQGFLWRHEDQYVVRNDYV
jgi:hypothetical protein